MSDPILVVGAGPVGLCLATALLQAGLEVQVFEQDAVLSDELRGGAYHPPTLERFQRWGVLDAVQAESVVVRELRYWERRSRECLAAFSYDLIADDTPHAYRLHCMQHRLTRLLLPRVQAAGALHMQHRLLAVEATEGSVLAQFETAQGRRTVRGSWLCGSDGARSTLRKLLGVPFEGMTYEDRFLVCNGQFALPRHFPGAAPVNYVFDPVEWVIALRLPGFERIVFRVPDGADAEAMLELDDVHGRLLGFLGSDARPELSEHRIYRVHQRVAARFVQGRCVLLGDAAHVNNPAGGMGLNSGIHDADALAQALVAVSAGADPRCVDEAMSRRRQLAHDQVQSASIGNYANLTAFRAEQIARRNAAFERARRDPAAARAMLLRYSMLEVRD